MADERQKFDPLLLQLILSLQAGAMQQMGKTMSPISGKVERDLELARMTIDMIGVLETKMKGNLTDDEAKLIGRVLYELRLNYVDETKKGKGAAETGEGGDNTGGDRSRNSEPSVDSGPTD